jgi:hypothetical protein
MLLNRFIYCVSLFCGGVLFSGFAAENGGATGGIPVIDTHIHLYDTARH